MNVFSLDLNTGRGSLPMTEAAGDEQDFAHFILLRLFRLIFSHIRLCMEYFDEYILRFTGTCTALSATELFRSLLPPCLERTTTLRHVCIVPLSFCIFSAVSVPPPRLSVVLCVTLFIIEWKFMHRILYRVTVFLSCCMLLSAFVDALLEALYEFVLIG